MTETLQICEPAVLAEQLRSEPAALPQLIAPLSDAEAAALTDYLKGEADRHWWINANRSIEFADLIIAIGQARGNTWQVALGTMARGDALKFVGNIVEAWDLLGQAGMLFESVGDAIGWARTRIGRLLISVELSHVAEALADAARARAIFTGANEWMRLLGLNNNTAIVYATLGDYQRALEMYGAALTIAEQLGESGQRQISLLSIGIGYAYEMIGNFQQATAAYERAHTLFGAHGELRGMALAEHNLAYVAMGQGLYRLALQRLHHARDIYRAERLELDATHVSRGMIECLLLLNRNAEADTLAHEVAAVYRAVRSKYREAATLVLLATAQARQGTLAAASATLDQAEQLFHSIGAQAWAATAQLRRGQIALRTGNAAAALAAAAATASIFQATGKQLSAAEAILLQSQALLASGQLVAAQAQARQALQIAKRCNAPTLRYSAHLLGGTIAEAHGQPARAARHYTAAMATIDRVQRGLTITLRPAFLDDKRDALPGLMRLRLRAGQHSAAFETLEHSKSQALLSHLDNREQLRWSSADPQCQALLERLELLRQQHHWFYRRAHELLVDHTGEECAIDTARARSELADCARALRDTTERLYLCGEIDHMAERRVLRLAEVQGCLDPHTVLIEYYDDGESIWAFTLDAGRIDAHQLGPIAGSVGQLIAQFQANIDFALKAGPHNPATAGLTVIARRMLQRLYALLLAPLEARYAAANRLIIVPYGRLHYLPFQLLIAGSSYLIERYELVTLPTAALIARSAPHRQGATILTHSWEGRLRHTAAEGQVIQRYFSGRHYCEAEATRAVLQQAPAQILHIAAHGRHRLDQPELSYIELADGQLYSDDLLQHDLSYELVVLSACETGRASVAAGDELIGVGRGFLYAGAGALITSLWRVADDTTITLMQGIYAALHMGCSKAAALRAAQRAVLAEAPDLHPAFWGAFQLMGDAGPLSA